MVAPTQEFYRVNFQALPPLLRGLTLRPLTVPEFTLASELLLEEARRTSCPYWLLDCRADRARQQPELYYWIEDHYLPRVRTALGRVPIVAFLGTSALWQQLEDQGNAAPEPTLLSGAFRTEWFVEEAPALTWLDQFRTLNG